MDYKYYEKPTTTNTTVRKTSAMSENPKVQCLSNDLVRRLLNTREQLPNSYRTEVVDGYGRKLMTSGYTKEQTRRILVNGIKGYMNKVARRRRNGTRTHLTAEESSHGRIHKKLLGQTLWYKGGKRKAENATGPRGGGGFGEDTCEERPCLVTQL